MLEKAMIAGITSDVDEAVYEVETADSAKLFQALADASVNVDTVIQIGSGFMFSAPQEDRAAAAAALEGLGVRFNERDGLGKVSVVGAGMKTHPGVAAKAFSTLADSGVESHFVSTSPIKIAFYVSRDDVDRSVRALHDAFELAESTAEREHDA